MPDRLMVSDRFIECNSIVTIAGLKNRESAASDTGALSSVAYFDGTRNPITMSLYMDMVKVHCALQRQRPLDYTDSYESVAGEQIFSIPDNRCVELHEVLHQDNEVKRRGGVRGRVSGFSRASRKRMFDFMASVRDGYPETFVTLTYPDKFPVENSKQWKNDFEAMRRRIERLFSSLNIDARILWRQEHKPRQSGKNKGKIAPHWHYLVWTPEGLTGAQLRDVMNYYLKDDWHEIVGSGDKAHAERGMWIEEIKSRRHAYSYVAKYVGKVEDDKWDDLEVGRRWGRIGSFNTSASLKITLNRAVYVQWRRLVRSWLKARGKGDYAQKQARASALVGCTVYGVNEIFGIRLLDHACNISREMEKEKMAWVKHAFSQEKSCFERQRHKPKSKIDLD